MIKYLEHPFIAIVGGVKVSRKIALLESLFLHADHIIIGGELAYSFLNAKGIACGSSFIETEMISTIRNFLEKAYHTHKYIYLPIDHIVAQHRGPDAECKHVVRNAIEEGWMGMDIGPLTCEKFIHAIKGAKTIFWNGPMGVTEFPCFAKGTNALACAIAEMAAVTSVVVGEDSATALQKAGVADKIGYVSATSSACLELVQSMVLPDEAASTPTAESRLKSLPLAMPGES